MEWFILRALGGKPQVEVLPGLKLLAWQTVIEASSGMLFTVERLRVVCEWFP